MKNCLHALKDLPGVELLVEHQSLRAAERLENERPGVLITALRMPELSGVELLRLARERDPNVIAVVLTAHAGVEVRR